MDSRRVEFRPQDPALQLIFEKLEDNSDSGTMVGTVRLAKGAVVPTEGQSVHAADEYGYILKGRVRMTLGDQQQEVTAGTFTRIPAGEAHLVYALEDSEILWWWVGTSREFQALKQQYPFAE